MAIGTPTSLGSSVPAVSTTTHTHSTTAAVPSAGLVVVTASWGSTAAALRTGTLSGGSLTWTKDHEQGNLGAVSVGWTYAIFSAPAPAGLASATTLTLTTSGTTFGANITACYDTGLDLVTPKDVSDGNNLTAAAWDTTATSTTVADTLVIGGCLIDATTSSTPAGGATELFDVTNANAWTHVTQYQILSSVQSASLTGTWLAGGTADKTAAFVAYKASGAAAAADPLLRTFNAIPFMGR